MLDGIHENSILIEEITLATNEQSGAIIEVTTAVKQVDEMTQHNAALVEETNAAIEQTENQAVELDRIVETSVVDEEPVRRQVRPATPAPQRKVASAARTYLAQGNAAIKTDDWVEF